MRTVTAAQRTPVATQPVSRFSRLARTHAAMAAGDAALAVALADSVLFSIDADAARGKVLLFLGVSFVPFLFVAPLIGPFIDRMKGGRRFVVQLVCVARVVLSILMAFHADNIALFPLAFAALVMQKTYAICKSALVPTVVRSEEELVEANSKLGLISGLVGFVALLPAGLLQKTVGTKGTMLYAAAIFVFALLAATRMPRDVVAAKPANRTEQQELHGAGLVLAVTAMLLIRASVGFTFFHLFFWFKGVDAGLVWFGLSLSLASVLTMVGNAIAPALRHRAKEETMLVGSLAVIAAAGIGTAALGGVASGVLLAGAVNFSASIGRLAVDSIVQRDAPGANRGRAFARFETRFQLGWVVAGVIPVVIEVPGQLGFLIVGIIATGGAASYLLGSRSSLRRRREAGHGDDAASREVRPERTKVVTPGRPPPRPDVRRGRAAPARDQELRAPTASEVRRQP
jgi:hypothetical protein